MSTPTKIKGKPAAATNTAENTAINIALCIAYNGAPFMGWQVQPHGPSIQGRLEEAFRINTRQEIRVIGSGRTDAGVHAFNQIANAWVPASTNLNRLRMSLNGLAGPDIVVKSITPVPDDFNARHSAIGKLYRYQLHNRSFHPVFNAHRCLWVKKPLDIDAMNQAARHFLGTRDFSAFRSRHCEAHTPVRTLARVEILPPSCDEEAHLWGIEMEGTGFLQHMARIITGTLVAVGHGKLHPDEIPRILDSGQREGVFATAPARGLHLVRVYYDLRAYPQLRGISG